MVSLLKGILLKQLELDANDNEFFNSEEKAIDIINKKLSIEEINKMKNEKFKIIDINDFEEISPHKKYEINTSMLKGSSRVSHSNFNNWFDFINDLHKISTVRSLVDDWNTEKIIKNDPPVVYCLNGEYFIGNDGKHRLTISKILNYKIIAIIIELKIKK